MQKEETKKSKKEKILMVALTLVLVLVLVGTTYAIFTFVGGSTTDNAITTGTISMTYTEPSNALVLENALPMSDEEGMNQTDYFEFTVTTTATGDIEIPYEINITPLPIDEDKQQLPEDVVYFGLWEVDSVNSYYWQFSKYSISTLRSNSRVLSTKVHNHDNSTTITSKYQLRTWIDESFDISDETIYQYKFRVNVDSKVGVIDHFITPPDSCFEIDKEKGAIIRYYEIENDNYEFNSSTGEYEAVGNPCPNEKIIIPSQINGVIITEVGGFFYSTISEAIISEGIKKLSINSFSESSLNNILLPNTLEIIGDGAFYRCNLKNINIPSSVTYIGEQAFLLNELTSIVIPDSVTTIGASAFQANQLTKITIPNTTVLGKRVFNNNQLIGDEAFIYSRNSDGVIDNTALISYGGAERENVVIPSTITSIGNEAFMGNDLISITIPNSVSSIGDYAFAYNQLTSIEIPDSVTSIGNRAFQNNKLTSVVIKGKSSVSEFTLYDDPFTFAWATGYSGANITWQP